MQIAIIGLGRMGANITRRLLRSSAVRTADREKRPTTAEHGYLHCGPSGTGHFVKMVHNGIEDGIMAAYAEGFNILHPELSEFEGCVSDSGEGRWTLKAAIDEGVPANAAGRNRLTHRQRPTHGLWTRRLSILTAPRQRWESSVVRVETSHRVQERSFCGRDLRLRRTRPKHLKEGVPF